MFSVASDEGFDKRGLADSRRANDGDDDWGRVFRQAIDERDMKTFLFNLEIPNKIRAAHTDLTTHLHRVSEQLVLPIDRDLRSQKL